jgi:hypothetical protein
MVMTVLMVSIVYTNEPNDRNDLNHLNLGVGSKPTNAF